MACVIYCIGWIRFGLEALEERLSRSRAWRVEGESPRVAPDRVLSISESLAASTRTTDGVEALAWSGTPGLSLFAADDDRHAEPCELCYDCLPRLPSAPPRSQAPPPRPADNFFRAKGFGSAASQVFIATHLAASLLPFVSNTHSSLRHIPPILTMTSPAFIPLKVGEMQLQHRIAMVSRPHPALTVPS